jgi:Mn2+/Fe2+ NRAMP family transporter
MKKGFSIPEIKKNLANIGPAALISATAMGPGTITSCLLAGSAEGYRLLWFVAFSGFFAASLAILGGKVYIVTGKLPFEIISQSFGKWLAYINYCLILLSGYYVIAVEGKLLGFALKTIFPSLGYLSKTFIVLAVVILIAVIFSFGFKRVIFFCTLLSACMALVFFFNFFVADISWKDLLLGLIPRFPEKKIGYLAMAGIMGGAAPGIIIMMYAYCVKNKNWTKLSDLKQMKWDQYIYLGILFGLFSVSIYISGAAMLYGEVIVKNLGQAAASLKPIAGMFGIWIFSIGIFITVFTTIGGLANVLSYFLADLINIPSDLDHRKFKKILFCTILIAALGSFMEDLPIMQHLPLAMVFFLISGLICFAVYLVVSNKKSVMGDQINHFTYNIILISLFIFDCFFSIYTLLKVFA